VFRSSLRPLPGNKQETDIHTPGGIRTHSLSRITATDLRLRPCDYWDRQCLYYISKSFTFCCYDYNEIL